MKEFIDTLHRQIVAGDETEAVNTLDGFIDTHGVEAFHELPTDFQISLDNGVSIQASLLWFVAKRNYLKLARRLIDLKVNLEKGISSEHGSDYDGQSPLMAACEANQVEMISLLLDPRVNLTHRSSTGIGIMWKVQNAAVCKIILDEAKKRNLHLELLAMKSNKKTSAFEYSYAMGYHAVLYTILTYELIELQERFVHSEEQVLIGLDRFLTLYPSQLLNNKIFPLKDSKTDLFYHAVKRNYLEVARRLIELGVAIDERIEFDSLTNGNLHLATPLIVSCYYGHVEMTRLLLDSKADILRATHNGLTALMLANNVETVQLLLTTSSAQGRLSQLVAMRSVMDLDAGSYQCKLLNFEAVNTLMALPDFHRMLNVTHLLQMARLASTLSPEKSVEFNDICQRLRPFQINIAPIQPESWLFPEPSSSSASSSSTPEEHPEPSGQSEPVLPNLPPHPNSDTRSFKAVKTGAIHSFIEDYYQLLCSPKTCLQYLRFLNDELEQYYQAKYDDNFPVLDRSTIEYQLIGEGLFYPVPNLLYKGINKHRALSELLISIFRQYGLAEEQGFKWIGFIPQEIANEQVKKGDFITEGTYGNGLFHGKLTHMIQRAILIYAVEDSRLNLSFEYQSERHQLNFQDIFDGLVSFDDPVKRDSKLWMRVQDTRSFRQVEFCDPYRLASTIMVEGHKKDSPAYLPALSDSLTDSFCKGFLTYYEAYKKHTPFEIDMTDFLVHVQELSLHLFSSNPTLFELEKHEVLQKRGMRLDGISYSYKHAVVPKYYNPNALFSPRNYRKEGCMNRQSDIGTTTVHSPHQVIDDTIAVQPGQFS